MATGKPGLAIKLNPMVSAGTARRTGGFSCISGITAMSWWRPLETSLPQTEDEVAPGFELTAKQRDAMVESLAQKVVARGMEVPAVLLLEVTKPVSFLVSQAVLVAGPMLYPFFGFERIDRFAGFLNSRENVEMLIQRIEELAEGKGQ